MTFLLTSTSECRRSPQGRCTAHQRTAINRIVLVLIGIELFFASMFALVGPFVAVFISQSITGPTMLIVGTATMLFLITKSALQIPFSRFVDRAPSENFVVGILSGGYAIIALAPLHARAQYERVAGALLSIPFGDRERADLSLVERPFYSPYRWRTSSI